MDTLTSSLPPHDVDERVLRRRANANRLYHTSEKRKAAIYKCNAEWRARNREKFNQRQREYGKARRQRIKEQLEQAKRLSELILTLCK